MAKKQLEIIHVIDGRELADSELPEDFDSEQSSWSGYRFLRDYEEDLPDPEECGFCFRFDEREDDELGRNMWVYAEEYGDIELLAHLVLKFLRRFRSKGYWSVAYASTCSKPRLDSFGGGAVFVTANSIKSDSSWDFVKREAAAFAEQLARSSQAV